MQNRGTPPNVRAAADPAWLVCLRARLRALPELSERHADMVAGVEARTHVPRTVLERAYDLAREAGLDPALALELVGCGVSVVELDPEPTVAEEAHSSNPPDWVAPPAAPVDVLVLERRLRLTFRRLRTLLEREDDLNAAIEKFAREPDVRAYDFRSPLA
jgi:hypothetical protein